MTNKINPKSLKKLIAIVNKTNILIEPFEKNKEFIKSIFQDKGKTYLFNFRQELTTIHALVPKDDDDLILLLLKKKLPNVKIHLINKIFDYLQSTFDIFNVDECHFYIKNLTLTKDTKTKHINLIPDSI